MPQLTGGFDRSHGIRWTRYRVLVRRALSRAESTSDAREVLAQVVGNDDIDASGG
jgi:hypothetical protein